MQALVSRLWFQSVTCDGQKWANVALLLHTHMYKVLVITANSLIGFMVTSRST